MLKVSVLPNRLGRVSRVTALCPLTKETAFRRIGKSDPAGCAPNPQPLNHSVTSPLTLQICYNIPCNYNMK